MSSDPVQLILQAMTAKSISREELAERIGASKSQMAKILTRQRRLDELLAGRIAGVLGIPYRDLIAPYNTRYS